MTAAIPARAHTRRGIADARGTTLCKGQPDPDCPCAACVRRTTADNRHSTPYERPAYGSGE